LQQQKEKVRLYALARELHMESKDLLDLCRQNGIDIKNQLSSLEPEQRDQIVSLVKRGPAAPANAPARPAAPPTLPPAKVPVLSAQRRPDAPAAPGHREPEPAATKPTAPATPAAPITPVVPVVPAASTTPTPTPAEKPIAPVIQTPTPAAPAAKMPEAPVATPSHPPEAPAAKTPETPPAVRPPQPAAPAVPPTPRPIVPPHGGAPGVRNLNAPRPGAGAPRRDRPIPRPPQTGNFRIAPPPPLKQQRPAEPPKPVAPTGPRKISEIPKELQNSDKPITIENILNKTPAKPASPGFAPPVDDMEDEEGGDKKKAAGGKRPGLVVGRDARHKERNARQAKRKESTDGPLKGDRLTALIAGEETNRGTRLKARRPKHKAGPQPRKGKVPITLPITVRSLSEAIGVKSGELLFKLMGHGLPPNININTTLEPDIAETVALENGCELDVKRGTDVEGDLLADYRKPDRPEDLVPRAPIVTIMGHVDHGKTSLLDKIRHSNVTATEAGGITQVIRAWRVDHNGHPITFLDTPGHEAFTKMRARGANVTDIAVIVVAVDDGVMPQTEEAISHAKAAGVSMVVALNKVDLPNANLRKTEQQLYGMNVLPDNMGGDTPFVQTSAATGKGIDELLDSLALVAELKELKANPNKPAGGTCLEAYLSEEEGVYATLLVRDGTLRRGDVVLCGATYGRVRAMYDDMGRPIQEAGPTVPVRITGLDAVPNADDPFQVVPDLATAREVAEKRKDRQQEAALFKRQPLALENLTQAKIVELKIILKAEARGSIEAIRKELEKLHHEEVRVRLLYAAIGGITESDVQLALASPQDTLILGFNVVPDDRAMALADERGISIREYDIIYKLTEDVRAALEGKLKPREEVIHLGRAVVRETFKISRVGTIAGCYVTQGTIERSAKVRVIRGGAVIYPPAERSVGLDSLKRFKEDVREVREGFECGIKVSGYDDIKVDDVIEAYRVEQVQRTLS
jgi:translation initiation factor IF-2